MSPATKRRRRAARGVTLLEVMVAAAILTMVATMIWGAFSQTGKSRKRITSRQEEDQLARSALAQITRDIRAAFLSGHVNHDNPSLTVRTTLFVGHDGSPGDTLDLTTFTHRRLVRGSHEGDSCEVGYRVESHQGSGGSGYDLLRRESPRIDDDPQHGGVLDVFVPDVVSFDLKYYDPPTDTWIDSWDSTQSTEQLGRLPGRVRVTLVLKDVPTGERRYSTETDVMLQRVLTFGLPGYN